MSESKQHIKIELKRADIPMICTDCHQYIPQGAWYVHVQVIHKQRNPVIQLILHRTCAKMLGADLHLEIARI